MLDGQLSFSGRFPLSSRHNQRRAELAVQLEQAKQAEGALAAAPDHLRRVEEGMCGG